MAAAPDRDLLKESLQKIRALRAELDARDRRATEPIAIIGAGCRFPGGSDNPDRYWQLLIEGRDAVRDVPRARWDVDAYYDPDPDVPGKSYVRSGGFLDDIEGFDADFFGIAPREAVTLDPQQRLLLEVGWEALEHAGIAPDSLRGTSTGVYVGTMTPDYAFRQAHTLDVTDVDPYMLTGNDASFAAGRLSYVLGLQGPAMVISTACSSSLVSLHTACQALRAGECDLALAGGVNALIDPVTNIMLSRLRALSRDGRCRTFDAAADGYGRGEGCGLLVLARLPDAIARGARILALVRGSAVNHDGPSAGLTVPNGSAQEKLLRRALAAARVEPEDVSYVEAHGTGTALGDPIELRALAAVLGTARRQPLLVGSVKTNVGHLEAAAGVAAVLKTALALRHGIIPPHLHFQTPNPHVPWSEIGIRVPVEAAAWNGSPRIAGISSFGLSGVNAHVVLEAPPDEEACATDDAVRRVLPISARSAEALDAQVTRYEAWLDANPGACWADVCHTAATGRAHFAHRIAVVASSVREAREALRSAPRARVASHDTARSTALDADAIAREYLQGASIEWRAADQETSRRRLVDLPTYAFQRTRYWVLDSHPGGAVHQTASLVGTEADRTAPDRRRLAAANLEAAIAEVLGVSSIDGRTDASLVELGLDSLMATELRGWIRDVMQVDVELSELLSSAAIETLVAAIHAGAASGTTGAAAAAEGARESERRFPLSAGQRALWFIHASAPESPAYNVGMAFRLESRADRHALTTALQMVVDRHPMLRARFRHESDALVQEIDPRGKAVIDFVEASQWNIDELHEHVLADYRRPFDLTDGPAFRVSLYERGDEPVLLFALHHIICDATSCWTMLEDLQRALAAGSREGKLPAPSATYEQFATWQNGMLAGAEGERLWAYWRERLGGDLPVLALPLDRERPASQTFNGASLACTVDRRLTGELKALARARGVTLHVLLLATFQALLHRLTGQDDLIVGSAALARPAGFEEVVGYFVNTLPIRVRAADDPAFTTFVTEVRDAVLGAMAHQHFPFAAMVERLQPRRDPGRPPIVQADFAVTRPPTVYRGDALARAGGLALTPFDLAEEEGQFDIGLHVSDAEAELVGTFTYNADLFEHATIAQIGRCWQALLASVTARPETPLSALPLLSPDERARTLARGRGPDLPYESISFIEMFERQAIHTPTAIAVERHTPSGDVRTITYAELQANIDRLAARLGRLGVGRDVTVGVVLPRSAEIAAALLAVMRAGGAYVPIDPSYPDARIEWMLADARVGAVITTSSLAARVKTPAPVVCVDDRDAGPPQPDWRADAPSPDDLAYVIYTSGSTGQPKGVAVTHAGLTNYVSWALDAYDVASGCGAPVSSSIGFDATITSLLLPLAAGTRLIMLPERESMQALATVLAEGRGFSVVKITPAHLEVLAQLLPDEACAEATRALVIGGEALRGDMLARWQQHAASTRLFNEYGPTETVVGCCVHEVTDPVRGAVPIGRPIANTQLYVLDRRMEPTPIGVVGELYIGGAGVARGYLHRPELTRERFVPDPFDPTGTGRLYRTGDLVRLRADGPFEFIGRIDDQVKLRGYRIEPAEIEAAIKEHGTVAEAAVVVREDQPGHRQLVAYIVPSQGSCDVAALRRDLAARLPEFMRPSAVVVLDRLPLTANGKLDRGALPRPESASMRQRFTAPRDSTEMRLAALWEELLDVRPIGVRDDFFDVGGHSLLAVRLMARVRDAFGADIALADVLRAPTIERLADRIRAGETRRRSSLVPIQPSGSRRPLFCVPGAGGNTIYFYSLARQLGSDQPFYGLQGVGFDGEAPPHESVEQMAAHAIGEIRARQPHGPYAIGGHSLGAWVAYEMAQRLAADGESVSLLALIDTPVPHPAAVRDTSDWDQARWIVELADRIARLLDPSLSLSLEALRRLDETAQLEAFRGALHRTDLFPGEAGAAHLANALALFRAHSRVRYTARPAPASIVVTLLRTAAPPPHLAAVAGDPTWGWGALARVDVHQLPGDHLAILRPPHVAALADALSTALERAEASIGAPCLQRSF